MSFISISVCFYNLIYCIVSINNWFKLPFFYDFLQNDQ